jgi:alpha-glucoside transport system permease protein
MTGQARPATRDVAPVSPWRPALLRSLPVRLAVLVICFLWTIPTLGLLVTSVRNPDLISDSGWWTSLLHPFAAGQ